MTVDPARNPAVDELAGWFSEFHRLVEEAEQRFTAGHVLPALASLAAVPMVHRRLAEGCAALVEGPDESEPRPDVPHGSYL